jgi:hypothetical protein
VTRLAAGANGWGFFTNCTFSNNTILTSGPTAAAKGAAIYLVGGGALFVRCNFINNAIVTRYQAQVSHGDGEHPAHAPLPL